MKNTVLVDDMYYGFFACNLKIKNVRLIYHLVRGLFLHIVMSALKICTHSQHKKESEFLYL